MITSVDSSSISINIGGQTFFTKGTTLKKSLYFNQILEHNAGKIFVDRDAGSFQWVLNHLRGYTLCFTHGPLAQKENQMQLLDDAKFYGIESLETLVLNQLEPQPTYSDLLKVDEEYHKEWTNIYKILDEVSHSSIYIPIAEIDKENAHNLALQIKCRKETIKEWKIQRYMQSCKKMVLSLCMILEYVFPTSAFTANLGANISKKLNDNSEIKEELRSAVTYYLEERANKPFSPILKLFLSLMVATFFQGIAHPQEESNKPKLNIKEIFYNY